MGELLGYARVSTLEQNAALQRDALGAARCRRVFTDHVSGATEDRPELGRLLEQVRAGDTVVVWRLDRLGRSLRHLIEVVESLSAQQVGFRSVTEAIDTTTSGGRLIFHVFGALAEFERDLIRERTLAGLASARARGRMGGRPSVMSADKTTAARRMYAQQELSVAQIAQVLGVSHSSVYRALRRVGDVGVPPRLRTIRRPSNSRRRPVPGWSSSCTTSPCSNVRCSEVRRLQVVELGSFLVPDTATGLTSDMYRAVGPRAWQLGELLDSAVASARAAGSDSVTAAHQRRPGRARRGATGLAARIGCRPGC